jgi:hypothetical protein
MTKYLITSVFLLISFQSFCQTRCVDIIDGLEPDPYELLNDSISSIATNEQIQALIKEDNLIFTYKLNLRTFEISDIRMDYFADDMLDGSTNLSPEIITNLELFFLRNLHVEVRAKHSKNFQEELLECAFMSQVYGQ